MLMKGVKMKTEQDIKTCDICHKEIVSNSEFTTGYGMAKDGSINCYECCAKMDKAHMKTYGKTTLYLNYDFKNKQAEVQNWPGTLKIPCTNIRIGRHNIAGKRYDVWFNFSGYVWHGIQYGDNTQLCHCKQTKQIA